MRAKTSSRDALALARAHAARASYGRRARTNGRRRNGKWADTALKAATRAGGAATRESGASVPAR